MRKKGHYLVENYYTNELSHTSFNLSIIGKRDEADLLRQVTSKLLVLIVGQFHFVTKRTTK